MSSPQKPSLMKTYRAVPLMFFRAMVGAYGLNIVLSVIATLLIGERWVFIAFLNTFAQILWLPVFILIPICLLMREWRLAGMMLPGLIAFIFLWGGMFIPRVQVTPENRDIPLRILSSNMLAGNTHVDAYVSMIQELDADIVLLQELHHPLDMVLMQEFADSYPYMAFHPGGTAGQGVMSRYPIEVDSYWRYDFLLQALGHQRVEIYLNQTDSIVIYNVHPSHPGMQGELFNPESRSREIADLLDRLSGENRPVILAGDFNMPDFSDDYRSIRRELNDSFRDTGYGFGWTFPNVPIYGYHLPFIRLDYIFYSDDFRSLQTLVYPRFTGSDHRALYTDLMIDSEFD